MKPWCIYALKDPRTQDIRYIGRTVNLERRLRVHLNDDFTNTRKYLKAKEIEAERPADGNMRIARAELERLAGVSR